MAASPKSRSTPGKKKLRTPRLRRLRRPRTYSRKPGASLVTPKRVKIITDAIAIGVPQAHACHLAGIDESTLTRAMKKRNALCMAIKQANSKLIQGLTSIILIAAKNGQWTAAAWLLERRWPENFAKVERTELSGPGGTPLPPDRADFILAVREALGFVNRPPQVIEAEVISQVSRAALPEAQSGGNGAGGGAQV